MSRRRLGASIPPDARLRAYELRLRELVRQTETLAAAAEELDRRFAAGDPTGAGVAVGDVLAAIARLETIAHRPFRRPRPALERPRPGMTQLRTTFGP